MAVGNYFGPAVKQHNIGADIFKKYFYYLNVLSVPRILTDKPY